MPFDHSTFDTDRAPQLLIESGIEQLGEEMFPEREACTRVPVTSRASTIPRMPLGYANGRSDKRAKIAEGDRAVIYSSHIDSISYLIERSAAAFDITHIARAELETMQRGGPLNFLSVLAQRQILTEMALDWNVIVSGAGSAGDNTLVDIVALPAGDEFNDGSSPAKTPEQYIREAVQFTKGDTMAIEEEVLWGLLANPTIDENDLNQRSMTEAEFAGWLSARGIKNLIVLKSEAQNQDPRLGYSVAKLHSEVCVIGKLKAVQYVVFNDLDFFTVRDDFAKTDYLVADADCDFVVGYKESVRAFTNTMAA